MNSLLLRILGNPSSMWIAVTIDNALADMCGMINSYSIHNIMVLIK